MIIEEAEEEDGENQFNDTMDNIGSVDVNLAPEPIEIFHDHDFSERRKDFMKN